MWRKSSEAKVNPASHTPAPAQEKTEETPQASPEPSAPSIEPSQDSTSPNPMASTAPSASETPALTVSAPAAPTRNARHTPAPGHEPTREPVGPDTASTISAGLRIKGEITGSSDLTVDGETQGKIRTNGRVTVGPKGNVNDIDAREIVVFGTVHGNLKATESVRLGPSSHVEGSVLTPRISIDDGARLRGNVEMVRAGETGSAAETSKPAANVRAASAHED